MKDNGRINSDVLSPRDNFRGVNALAFASAYNVVRLERMQAIAAENKDYTLSDQLRSIASDLRRANEYLGIKYEPPKGGK